MADAKKILIVEDDHFLSSLLRARLEKEAFTITQAFDGEQAVELLKKEKPDLIILDLIMPKLSGFEVLERISINPQLNRIPIITLTNLAQDADVQKVKRLGAREYFVKVRISIDQIIEQVKKILATE